MSDPGPTVTATHGAPAAEFDVSPDLVASLLKAQHPDLAELPLRQIQAGWDNAMFRLGEDYLVRLPRRQLAVPLLRHEQVWLSQIAGRLPLPIPAPLRIGEPSPDYPCGWSVLPWIAGQTADVARPREDQHLMWIHFLTALHQPAPSDIPVNAYRGGALTERADSVEERLQRLSQDTDWVSPAARLAWSQALDAPQAEQTCVLHGDLHPQNVLVREGLISGVIDWGDITGGDPATDLASLWMLFDNAQVIEAAMQAYMTQTECDSAMLIRARGWVVMFGAVLADSGRVNNPSHAAMGRATLARL